MTGEFKGIASLADNIGDHVTASLDLFQPYPCDKGMKSGKMIALRPLSRNDNGPFDFIISSEGSRYVHLPSTRVFVQVKILHDDGTPVPAGEVVGVVNNFGPSLFSSIDIQLNGVDISTVSTPNAHYKSFFERNFSYGYDANKTHLCLSGWVKDVAEEHDNFKARETGANAGQNGFIRRYKQVQESSSMQMYFPLSSEFLCCEKLLPNDINVNVRLIRTSDYFSLLSDVTGKSYKIHFEDIQLFIRSIEVAPDILKQHQLLFNDGQHAKFALPRTRIEVFPIQGVSHTILPNIFRDTVLPHSIMLTMVLSEAYNGSLAKNPYNLEHFNMTRCNLKINGLTVPTSAFTPDFENDLFAREYASLFEGTGIHNGPHSTTITPHDYKNGNFALFFDLTPDACANYHNHPGESGVMDCEIIVTIILEKVELWIVKSRLLIR